MVAEIWEHMKNVSLAIWACQNLVGSTNGASRSAWKSLSHCTKCTCCLCRVTCWLTGHVQCTVLRRFLSGVGLSDRIQKKPNPLGFLGFIGFSDFLFEWMVGKLVGWISSWAKLLFRFTSTLDYLKICNFITYWSLEAVNIKKSLITTDMINWNWIKFDVGFCWFSKGFSQKKRIFGITRVSQLWWVINY